MHNLHFALVLFEGSGNSQSLYSTLSIHSLLNLIAMMSLIVSTQLTTRNYMYCAEATTTRLNLSTKQEDKTFVE